MLQNFIENSGMSAYDRGISGIVSGLQIIFVILYTIQIGDLTVGGMGFIPERLLVMMMMMMKIMRYIATKKCTYWWFDKFLQHPVIEIFANFF